MAKNPKTEDSILNEDRIDDVAIDAFSHMGATTRLSDNTFDIYKKFKHNFDMLHPGGRLSPGDFAIVKALADMADASQAAAASLAGE